MSINPCDIDIIINEMTKKAEKLVKDAKESFAKLAVKIGGNFLITVAILLATLIGSNIIATINNIILNSVTNLMNAVLSAILSVLSLISGADLVFQYYQVRSLRLKLGQEMTLLSILSNEATNIIDFLKWYVSMSKKIDTAAMSDDSFKRALKYVIGAKNTLDYEVARISDGNNQIRPVRINSVESARISILRAVDALTKNFFSESSNLLETISNQYSIYTKPPNVNMVSIAQGDLMVKWLKYYADLWEELKIKFFTYEAPEGTQARRVEEVNKFKLYSQIIKAILPEMPQIVQGVILYQMFSESAGILVDKLPLVVGLINKLRDSIPKVSSSIIPPVVTKVEGGNQYKAGLVTKPTNSNMSSMLAHEFGSNFIKPSKADFFTNSATKDLTINNISSYIKLYEAGILAFPSSWRDLMFLGAIELEILKATTKSLDSDIADITRTMDNYTSDNVAENTWNKTRISFNLTNTAQYLRTITANSGKIQLDSSTTISGNDLQNLVQTSSAILEELIQEIQKKTYDFVKNKPIEQPVDLSYKIAQKRLNILAGDALMLLDSGTVKDVVASLQSLKILWAKQLRIDAIELAKCNEYINVMESNSSFRALKDTIESLLNSIPGGTVASDIMNLFSEGNIMAILDIANGIEVVGMLSSSIPCVDNEVSSYMDSIIPTMELSPFSTDEGKNKILAIQNEIKESVKSLQDSKEMAENTFNLAIKAMNEELES